MTGASMSGGLWVHCFFFVPCLGGWQIFGEDPGHIWSDLRLAISVIKLMYWIEDTNYRNREVFVIGTSDSFGVLSPDIRESFQWLDDEWGGTCKGAFPLIHTGLPNNI